MGHYYVKTYSRIEADSPEEAELKAVQMLRPVSARGQATAEQPPRDVWMLLKEPDEKTPAPNGEVRTEPTTPE